MKNQPIFSIGQPVFVCYCYQKPYRVINIERLNNLNIYTIEARDRSRDRVQEAYLEAMRLDRRIAKFCIERVA